MTGVCSELKAIKLWRFMWPT